MADGSGIAPQPVNTTCPYCGVGCGVRAAADGSGGAEISGDTIHPANFGRLCSKGSALGETLAQESRLLAPHIGAVPVSWDTALDHVARELTRIRDAYGPKAIAFYLSGQLLTEDYYVANKLAKGFIGTPHVDTNSRLCMASSVAGHRRAFGADVVPGCYEDLDTADLIVLVGSNAAWCHPVLYQRMQKARQTLGTKIVNIDPRRTATSEGSDLQLSLRPGSDTILWNGLLAWLADDNVLDIDYIAAHTDGFSEVLAMARRTSGSVARVAFETGLAEGDVRTFYRMFGGTTRVVTCYSQGVNQAIDGTDKVNAIINCHLATGRIAKPGAGPLSLTGQPNAMGGREVGGLANMLAAHMGFAPAERDTVARFWNAPKLVEGEGYKAVAMFDAIARGEIKALWVIGTNPAVSMPRADAVRDGFDKLELFVTSEVVASNDTVEHAQVRLPASGWGEKNGTVTNSERRISRQRPFLEPAGSSRADWKILSDVAARLGFGSAFAYGSPSEVFREHAALSGFENSGARAFDISGLAEISADEYDALEPVQWPVRRARQGTARMFEDGAFVTPTRRANFVPIATTTNRAEPTDAWPIVLNTGRIRDQWHTMTRTGLASRLSSHIAEPFAEINPVDAAQAGVRDGYIVRLTTRYGSATVRAIVTDRVAAGAVFAPIHWSSENSSLGRIGALVHGDCDPVSGQPDLKATPAQIAPVSVARYGFALTLRPLPSKALAHCNYWARSVVPGGYLTQFTSEDHSVSILSVITDQPDASRVITIDDAEVGMHRAAVLNGARVEAVVYSASTPLSLPSQWLNSMLGCEALLPAERRALLAGSLAGSAADDSPVVCVCHQISAGRIAEAIAGGSRSTDAVGRACAAGTNCGSCLPEINRMIAAAPPNKAAAKVNAAGSPTGQLHNRDAQCDGLATGPFEADPLSQIVPTSREIGANVSLLADER